MKFHGAGRLAAAAVVATLARADGDLDLILYGADGCVGHFAASHLAKQPNLKWAIAGRTKAHLQAVADDLAKEGGNSSKPEIIVAALDGKSDPKTWVRRAKAVVTAAGPFSVHGGEEVVKACAETGVHYADTSDEFYWQRRMIDAHDASAQKSGAKILFSTGFCMMAGDLGSQLAIESLGASKDTQVAVDAWLETYNGGLSAGVLNTKKAIANASFPKEWGIDPYVLAPEADASLRVDTTVEGMSFPKWVSGEGLVVKNLFGVYDARLMRRSFTHLEQKVQLRVGASTGMYPRWAAFVAKNHAFASKKCPTEKVFDDGSWAYRFKASTNGKSETVLLSGQGDPGYRFTAWGLAEAGLCLAGKTSGCARDNQRGGIMTSMSALNAGALQKRLESVELLKVEKVKAESEVIV